ncbi:MAG: hypothetical protein FJ116_07085 [Deltaproteobacteria bacterium]|nr:hypothetical protein [Deltaproteobacteria bacterium]
MRFRVLILNFFVGFHLLGIFLAALPHDNRLTLKLNAWFQPYMNYVGLWQSWNMFAPEPRSELVRMDAEIQYQSGEVRVWEFPRIERLGLFERVRKERYRKWAYDNVRLDSNSGLWASTADFIALSNWDEQNPPVKVSLNRHWRLISNPKLSEPNQFTNNWKQQTFYSRRVRARRAP